MKRRKLCRILSTLLVLMMTLSLMPTAFAATTTAGSTGSGLRREWMMDQSVTLVDPAPWNLFELKQVVDVTDPREVAAYWVRAVWRLADDYDSGMEMMKYLYADIDVYGSSYTEGGLSGMAGWDTYHNYKLKDSQFNWLPRAYFEGSDASSGFVPDRPLTIKLFYEGSKTTAANSQTYEQLGRLYIVYSVVSRAGGNRVTLYLSRFANSDRWYVTNGGASSTTLYYDQWGKLSPAAQMAVKANAGDTTVWGEHELYYGSNGKTERPGTTPGTTSEFNNGGWRNYDPNAIWREHTPESGPDPDTLQGRGHIHDFAERTDQEGYYYFECTICGERRECCWHIIDIGNIVNCNDNDHWVECPICHEIGLVGPHSFRNGACEECGYSGRAGDPHSAGHTPVYTMWFSYDLHWEECDLCGARRNVHTHDCTYSNGISTCTVCGFTHECSFVLAYGPSECWEECVICNRDRNRQKHNLILAYDSEGHWLSCDRCHIKIDAPDDHTFENGVCTACGYKEHQHSFVWRYDGYRQWRECSICGAEATGNENPFVDVEADDYYYEAVLWAYEVEVTSGTSDTTFSPEASCTRGQVVTFLWRAAGCPEPVSTYNPFTDVHFGDYYYTAILWAVEQGITGGTSDTTFSPDQTCSSAHIATFLYRFIGGDDGWYEEAKEWAVSAGLTADTDLRIDPNEICPRGAVVTFLHRNALNAAG